MSDSTTPKEPTTPAPAPAKDDKEAAAPKDAAPPSPSPADQTEKAKKLAAYRAVDLHVSAGQRVGVGSGSTIVYAVQRLAERYHKEKLTDIVCVPTSFQATSLIVEAKLPLGDLSRYPVLDVAIDGADEVDDALNLIKGGGGCALQEKIVAFNAKQLVIIADFRKQSKRLGEKYRRIPLEVVPFAYVPVMNRVATLNGAAKVSLRMAQTKAGPTVTDNGNFIVDADWGPIDDPKALDLQLHAIPGIIETGLFCGMCHVCYFGQANGTVTIRTRNPNKNGSRSGRGEGGANSAEAVAAAATAAAAATEAASTAAAK